PIDADDFTSVLGEAHQNAHRARLELDRCAVARNLIESRIDPPLPESKSRVAHDDRGMLTPRERLLHEGDRLFGLIVEYCLKTLRPGCGAGARGLLGRPAE